jgi:NTE family protein
MVLSGGGVKAVAHIGALKALHELHLLDSIEIFVGTSIGSIIATLYVLGMTPDEMLIFIKMRIKVKVQTL